MLKVTILHEGKHDFSELEEIFTIGEFTYKKLDQKVKVSTDPFYKILTLDWPWFKALFTGTQNVRCVCLNSTTLKKNGVTHNGFFNLDTDGVYDFYISDKGTKYKKALNNGFKTAIAYMFVHEYMHGVIWGKTRNRIASVAQVHHWVDEGTLRSEFEKHVKEYESMQSIYKNALRVILARLRGVLAKSAPTRLKPQLPVPFERITQAYGVYNPLLYPSTNYHWGLDLRAAKGTPVKAPLDGEVIESGYSKALGYWLQFFDGEHYHVIPHLAAKAKLQKYKQGDVLGEISNTGSITAVHCHLEVWNEKMTDRVKQLKERGWDVTQDPAKYYGL